MKTQTNQVAVECVTWFGICHTLSLPWIFGCIKLSFCCGCCSGCSWCNQSALFRCRFVFWTTQIWTDLKMFLFKREPWSMGDYIARICLRFATLLKCVIVRARSLVCLLFMVPGSFVVVLASFASRLFFLNSTRIHNCAQITQHSMKMIFIKGLMFFWFFSRLFFLYAHFNRHALLIFCVN